MTTKDKRGGWGLGEKDWGLGGKERPCSPLLWFLAAPLIWQAALLLWIAAGMTHTTEKTLGEWVERNFL